LENVKIGVIGCGTVAETCHLPAVKGIPAIRVKALADVNEEQASQIAENFGLKDVSIFSDHRQLLKDSDIDAVWILTPPKLHAQMVADAIKCDKHVLCEKPFVTSMGEAEIIKKTLKDKMGGSQRLVLMPAHNFIFTPCFNKASQLIKDGKIGKIKGINSRYVSNLAFYRAKTDFRIQAKGGVIEDQMPHIIYMSQDLEGPFQRVLSVEPHSRGHAVAEDVDVRVELKNGVEASLSAAWFGFIPTFKFEIIGDMGVLSMDLVKTPYNLAIVKDGEVEKIQMGRRFSQYVDVLRSRHPSYFNEHLHFVRLINGEVEPRVTLESGFELVEALEKIMRVVDERQLPLESARREVVALARVEGDVEAAVRKSVALLGGLNIKRDARVIVKPNICFWKNTENMIITDPRVLEAVLKMVKERTDKVLVVESDNLSGTGDNRVKKSGILDVIEGCGAEFLNLSRDEYEKHEVEGLVIKVPKTVLKADYFINLPKIKTCNVESMFISIAMKNMFGVIADNKKTQFHKKLMEVLLYINQTIRQDMIIVDGVVAMEGLGPVWGKPFPLNLIISGFNPVTVDAVCCKVVGINPYAVETLWRAYKMGIGEIDISRVDILGENIENVRQKFSYPVFMTKNITGAIRTALKTYL